MQLVTDIRKSPGARRKSFLSQFVLVLVGTQLAFFGSFTSLNLPTATGSNLLNAAHIEVRKLALLLPEQAQEKIRQYAPSVFVEPKTPRYSNYTPMAPAAVLAGYVLGPRLALCAMALFLGIGMLGPWLGIYPLAAGGGVKYFLEPGFGYILGMVAASFVSGFLTLNKRTSLSQLLGIVLGLAALHLTGIVYLIGTYLYCYIFEGSKTYLEWQPFMFQYLRNLSWYAIPYDFAFAFLAVGIAFPFRWLVNNLTSTDAGQPPKRMKYNRKALEEMARN